VLARGHTLLRTGPLLETLAALNRESFLVVQIETAAAVERLPWHHRDPFDRLLVAQAATERAAVVTRDDALAPYGVTLVW